MKFTGVLSMDRIAHLKKVGPEFVSEFRSTFPGEHIPLKMHLIETHLLDWVEKYGSIGLFSEEAAESIHALIVRIERSRGSLKGSSLDRSIMNALREKQDHELQSAERKRAARRKRVMKRKTPST